MNAIYEEIRLGLFAVWQRRWLAIAVAWGICLLGWLVIALIPNSYQSQARVFVQMQSILPNKIGITQQERQRDIDRVRQTLTSTVNLEKVVRGTDLSLQATTDSDVAGMVKTLQKNITVKAQQDNLFEITATASAGGFSDRENAKLAKAVVQKLIDIFVEENLAGDRDETVQTLRFLDDELAKRERQLQEAEQKRAAFEQKYLGVLPGVGSVAQRLESARSELSQVDSQLAAAQGSLSALNGQLASTPATVSTPSFIINSGGPAVGSARGRIAALEASISDGQARGWTDQHPDVVAARAQIARLRGQAAGEGSGGGSGGGGGSTTNPLYVSLRSMLAEKQSAVAALSARKAQLQAEMAQFSAKQIEEPGVAAEQARLNRDYDVLKQQYDKLLGDREDVKLRNDVSNKTDAVKFRVIDPPSDPRLPVAPNRPLLLALILVVGVAGGAGAAFGQAQLRNTYSTAERLARASGLQVIGAISEVVSPARKEERRKKLVWFAGTAGALGGAFVLLLLVEFVQRGLVA